MISGAKISFAVKLPASAPISTGVKPLLVWPSKSVAIAAIANPAPSATVVPCT